MFLSYSHHNLSTFLPNVSGTPAIFSISVSRADAMFLSRAADVLEPLQLRGAVLCPRPYEDRRRDNGRIDQLPTTAEAMRAVARALPADGAVNVGDGERWLSLLGGGLLALYTLRRSLGTVVLLGGAGALLYRGLKGQCALYQAMDVNHRGPRPAVRKLP